jgi:predicted ArsR family transcriptional regulator
MAMTTTLQEQARALGDPTRHGIFRYVADADRPVDVAELTEFLGFNHNAIRQHLTKLVDAGLVTEDLAPRTGRGRPRLVYRLNPAAESRWGVTGPYERLSLLLVEILRSGDSAVEVGRRSVRRQRLGSGAEGDPVGVVVEAMERQGFDPFVRNRGKSIELVLRNCPFETAALADSDTVCAIHLGIAQGVAALTGGRLVVDNLVPHDPRRANCQLRTHLESDTEKTQRAPRRATKPNRKGR